MYNKSQIMQDAHRNARGMMAAQSKEPAWREAREAFRPNNKKIKQLENKVLAIKCSVNRLQPHHWNEIQNLETEIKAIAA